MATSRSPVEPAQGPEFVAAQGVGAGRVLDPPHVQDGAVEVDLVPTQVAGLGGAQPMPEGQEEHGRVLVTVAVALGGFDKGLDFGRREVFAGAKFGVRPPQRANCPIYGCWRYQREVPFCHVKCPLPDFDCLNNEHFSDSVVSGQETGKVPGGP